MHFSGDRYLPQTVLLPLGRSGSSAAHARSLNSFDYSSSTPNRGALSEIVPPLRIPAFQRFGLNTGNYLEVANTFCVLYRTISEWRNLSIHESSLVLSRGANRRLAKEAPAYVESHYYRGVPARKTVNGIRYVGNSPRGSLGKYNDYFSVATTSI
jgi:hypothetical protein